MLEPPHGVIRTRRDACPPQPYTCCHPPTKPTAPISPSAETRARTIPNPTVILSKGRQVGVAGALAVSAINALEP